MTFSGISLMGEQDIGGGGLNGEDVGAVSGTEATMDDNRVPLHFVLDTNVFIALEPGRVVPASGLLKAAEFVQLAHSQGHKLSVTQATRDDLLRDPNADRRAISLRLLDKYPALDRIPLTDALLERVAIKREELAARPHDIADMEVLAAVHAHAVDFLVSEDRGLLHRAVRAGLDASAFTVEAAITFLRSLEPVVVEPPPRVERIKCYTLDLDSPFFDSLKADYHDFERWFVKIRREGRAAWKISRADTGDLEGLLITKDEDATEIGLVGTAIKACTFKVSSDSHGWSYGELLLKTLFEEARKKNVDYVYLTAFEKQTLLIDLMESFGFRSVGKRDDSEELILLKSRRAPSDNSLSPLQAHINYGPPWINQGSPCFVVPIRPQWHELLFPDASVPTTQSLLPGLEVIPRPYGNALRKAYICASTTKRVASGATLAFYRSEDSRSVYVIGVAERVSYMSTADEILQLVGRRTVYLPSDITRMLDEHRRLHVMLFRQDRHLEQPWSLDVLRNAGVLNGPPQSITEVRQGRGLAWMRQQLAV